MGAFSFMGVSSHMIVMAHPVLPTNKEAASVTDLNLLLILERYQSLASVVIGALISTIV